LPRRTCFVEPDLVELLHDFVNDDDDDDDEAASPELGSG
jgi:hypothetical protein